MSPIELQVAESMVRAQQLAFESTTQFIANHGDCGPCGFAWVKTYVKGSTKLGRALLKSGFKKSYNGGLEWWNPSGHHTQSVDAKEVGADAAADYLTSTLGEKFYAAGRLD